MLLLFIVSLTLPGISSQGDRIFYYDARSLGLGGVSIILENSANPAAMSLTGSRLLYISGWSTVQNERRGLRVYDSFGNNIGIRTVTNNTYTNVSAGPAAFVFPFKILRFGLQYAPAWDFNYYYRYEQRDDFYQLIRIDEISHHGYLHAFSPAVGIKYRSISLGVTYSLMRGTLSSESRVIIPQLEDSVEIAETEVTGNKIKAGLLFVPSLNFRLGYTYGASYEIQDTDFSYPEVHSIAVMYQPPGRIPTKFTCQVEVEMWDELMLVYKIGVEHMLMGKYALRYGFCIFPDYTEQAIWTTNLTVGFGMNAGRYFFDIGYAYGKRDYLNSDFQTFDVGTNYKFDETTHNFSLSTGLSF